ncbi:DUF1661 domain-containing protein [Porphyromonas gingivalis]|uniref:DUF1661 domain-containing protein n=1 Tax=Porphyromonas gingivalis TaxID=837 RepID=UPI00352BC0F2
MFTSRAKTKKFPSHVFPNAKPPFLRTDVYGIGEVKKAVIMSKHLTDSERLHIVEEYLGSLGASMPSRRSTTSPRGLLETIVRHFCDMTIGLFLNVSSI